MRKDRSNAMLSLVFLVVIGSFLGTSIFARHASSEIAGMSDRLASNVAPSIEVLASVRGSVADVEVALSGLLRGGGAEPARVDAVDASLEELRSALHQYLVLPLTPNEEPVHDRIQREWLRFVEEARYVRAHALAGDLERARGHFPRVESVATSLIRASMEAIELNAQYGQVLAQDIGESRRRTEYVAGALTVLSVLLGLLGAALLHRQARRRLILADERARALEERAAELEQFAGRVAHDIRGPIGAATIAVELLATRESEAPEEVAAIVPRLERSLRRTSAIVADLLEFARAGARPDPGARTSPHEVVDDVRHDLEAEAEKNDVELVWGEIPPVLVACNRGVYTSLLGNLVRNAIKYMGRSTTRRIVVRVADEGASVRTEVEDTGPGIPESQLGRLFDPYFRGENSAGREGLGLGLVTVRKLAEGHGGRVGVASELGRGSTFWFELPRAGSATE